MQISEIIIGTPYYVLMNQKSPFGQIVADTSLGIEHLAIFGFSGRIPYESFCRESSELLKPYPLVKGYLRNQLGASHHDNATIERCVKLVILDAPGPREPSAHAATVKAVLEAQEKGATHLSPTHHLDFDPEANVYRLESTPE